jgi:hypothetical protein
MEGGRKNLSLTSLVEVEWREADIKSELSSIHLQVCGEEKKGRTARPRLVLDGARRRALDMCMNDPSKSC